MTWRRIWLQLQVLILRNRAETQLHEELDFHTEMQIQKNLQLGMTPEEATRQARIAFGSAVKVEEECRDVRGLDLIENLARDIRYSGATLVRNPGFTAVAVLTLALGIGGTTAIFTLMDAVMLRPLPVSDPARLWRVGDGDDTIAVGRHGRWGFFSFPLYERLKAGAPEFEHITAFGLGNQLSVRRQGTSDAARPLWAEYVTGTYFSTLGVAAFGGRVFAPDDDRPSAPPVAVLSHHAWQGIYGADPSVVGSTL